MIRTTILALAACGAAWSADQFVLEKMEAAFDKAALERGLDGFISYFAADGVTIGPNQAPIRGHAALRAHYKDTFRPGCELRWKPDTVEMGAASDMGWTSGRYTYACEGNVLGRGRYFTVWKKQADGTWKVSADTGVPDKPDKDKKE